MSVGSSRAVLLGILATVCVVLGFFVVIVVEGKDPQSYITLVLALVPSTIAGIIAVKNTADTKAIAQDTNSVAKDVQTQVNGRMTQLINSKTTTPPIDPEVTQITPSE